jgi:adenine deaminase
MPGAYFTTSKEKIAGLMRVALGEAPADLAVINGDVVNVYTGEVMKRQAILVKGDTIAYVGAAAPAGSIGAGTGVIDAAGKTVIPGLIDGHTHADDHYLPTELVKWALRGSTTTIISETSSIGSAFGCPGVMAFIKACRNQPVRFFFTIPPIICVSPSAGEGAALTPAEMKRLLSRPDVVGLGELSWAQVNESNPRILETIAATIKAGKRADGHAAGAQGARLQAYFATGISSCHEPTTAPEVLERLRAGVFVLIREGTVRQELPEVSKIKDAPVDFSLLAVSSDGVGPGQLVKDGYMDFIVQKAIDHGFDPVTAVRMASLNVARHFGLDLLGGIAPGKLADMVVIPDLRTIKAEQVITGGKIAVSHGRLVMQPGKAAFPRAFYRSVHLDRSYTGADFKIRVKGRGTVKVRLIDQVSDLVTREAVATMAAEDGLIAADTSRDILKVAVIDRYWKPGRMAVGLIRGFGLKRGAIAGSIAWDCGHIVAVGAYDNDMAAAVNRIRELQGAVVVCADGRVLAELALPVGGLISDQPMVAVARKIKEIQQAAATLGTGLPDIHLSLQVLVTPSIPFLRICEEGLFNLKKNELVSLEIE